MTQRLRFGLDSTIDYEPPPSGAIVQWDGPREQAIDDVTAATAAALSEPLGLPALARAIVHGDKVVLALEPDVPCAARIVAATFDALVAGGVAADDVTILQAERSDKDSLLDDPRSSLREEYRGSVELVTHHGGNREELSYLTADEHDQPIYLNRRIVDADVVVPIGCMRADGPTGYGGVRAVLYPTFADQAAQQRCYLARVVGHERNGLGRSKSSRKGGQRKRSAEVPISQREAEHVAWLVGVLFTIQAVPAASNGILHILAGQIDHVFERGTELARRAWKVSLPERAALVVAALEGGPEAQTWDNVGRALAAAERVVAEDGIIVLCTELCSAPGPALRAVGGVDDLEKSLRKIRDQCSADLPVARQWANSRNRARIYFLSKLLEEQVERLGAAYVAEAQDVSRLIQRTAPCAILGSAQHVSPSVGG